MPEAFVCRVETVPTHLLKSVHILTVNSNATGYINSSIHTIPLRK